MERRSPAKASQALLNEQAERLSGLFDDHADRLYRIARRLVPHADDALDLVQDTFLRAAGSPASIPRGVQGEEAWLVRILVNVRRDQWRREQVRKRHDVETRQSVAPERDPEQAIVIRTIVWRALDVLSPRRRAVVVMYELEGLSVAEIASVIGINAVTVRWHLARGRRELAKQIKLEEFNEPSKNAVAGSRPAPSRTAIP
jgi:RNA polymerase sigma-70 factor (ECF subfamily)